MPYFMSTCECRRARRTEQACGVECGYAARVSERAGDGAERVELTVLDLFQRERGEGERRALLNTVALARRAERQGYARFWLAEHQGTFTPASACPEVMVAALAARTRRMRVGTAGVLLRYYSPLKVAETFRCLEALHPGRIDLGVARGHADDGLGPWLLDGRPEPSTPAAYREKVEALLRFLGHAGDGMAGTPAGPSEQDNAATQPVLPMGESSPEVWLLGTGDQGASLAAEYGTAFSYALFIRNDVSRAERAISAYRAGFRPSAALREPRWSIAVSGVCARTQRRAERLLAGAANQFLAPRASVVGTPERCRDTLEVLGERLGTRHFVLHAVTEDLKSRSESHRLWAAAFQTAGDPDGDRLGGAA